MQMFSMMGTTVLNNTAVYRTLLPFSDAPPPHTNTRVLLECRTANSFENTEEG